MGVHNNDKVKWCFFALLFDFNEKNNARADQGEKPWSSG
jgi:hypothetical protein